MQLCFSKYSTYKAYLDIQSYLDLLGRGVPTEK